MESKRRPNSSARRSPQPINMATIAWSRSSRTVHGVVHPRSRRPCSGVSQFAQTNADPPHTFHATNACRQLWTQEAGIGSLVRHTPNRGEPKVNRGRRIPALFQVNAVPEHNRAVEGEAGLRTVPGDELANGMVVGPLATGGCQAVQHRRLGLFEVRERQDALRRLLLARF
jgi:hypothetical protein